MNLQMSEFVVVPLLMGAGFALVVWLMRNQPRMERFRSPWVCAIWGVAFGAVSLILNVLIAIYGSEPEQLTTLTPQELEAQAAANQRVVEEEGLVVLVQLLAQEVQEPIVVEEGFALVSARANDTTLIYDVEVDTKDSVLKKQQVDRVRSRLCRSVPAAPLYASGGTVELVYNRQSDGFRLGTVVVNKALCDRL